MDAQHHERYIMTNRADSVGDSRTSSRLPDDRYDRRQHGARIVGLVLLTLGLAWMLVRVASDVMFPGNPVVFDQTVDGHRISIDADNASVTIIRWDRPAFRIQAQRVGWSTGDISVAVRRDGDTVHVAHGSTCWLFCSGIRYEISAPATAEVRVATVSGNVRIKSIEGDAEIHTISGDVQLDNPGGSLTIHTVRGNVTVHEGRVSNARIVTTSGDTSLDGVHGALAITSTSGAISVRNITQGPVNLKTTSGTISIDGALSGDIDIASVSGDVRMKLPEDASFRLFVRTISGDIDKPDMSGTLREWRTTIGDGAYALNITTTSGDVRVR